MQTTTEQTLRDAALAMARAVAASGINPHTAGALMAARLRSLIPTPNKEG